MTVSRQTPLTRAFAYAGALGFALFGIMLYAAPTSVGPFSLPTPWLAFMPVFVWAARRPTTTACVLSFCLGLAQDSLTGGPLGPWAAGFLMGYAFAASQRDALENQSTFAAWIVYAVAVASVAAGAGAVASIALGAPPALGALVWQMLVTIVLGPVVAHLFGGWRALAGSEERWA